MSVRLPPLEFTECITDSPFFRENLHKHEKELENTNHQIKRLIKEVKELLDAANKLSQAQRSFAKCLEGFKFECIGSTQTDDERVICKSLEEFSRLINAIEDERGRMLDNGYAQILLTLEDFRKKQIGGVKTGKKKFDKQTTKFCQCQERYLNLTVKKQNTVTLQEADASVDMAERHFCNASMEYVYLIQEVHERKKFEFVENLLSFMFSWLTFYHQGYEVAKDFQPYMFDLQCKIQKTRDNFKDYSSKLRKRMAEVQKQAQDEPLRNTKGRKEGYLFLLEKKAFGATWTKHYCTYDKETKKFTMLPYNQITSKSLGMQEELFLISCVRRMSDSIDKRFCFDLQVDSRPGIVYTFQALSETDRKSWMDIMDGKEPADASVDMAERHFCNASMEYVYLIQEVHERKKFEFVENLLSFMFSWLTFYHQGYEVAKDFQPYMFDLQCKIQKTRDNFKDYSSKLRKRMAEVQKQAQDEPLRNTKGRKEGYLFLLEKKAFGATWTKHYCTYDKETKKFTMLPYNQITSKSLGMQEELFLISCVRRMSDSIDKRFCFDLQVDSRPGIVYTFQALSETDRKSWMDIMDGKEPMYTSTGKPQNNEERVLDDVGITFVKRCIEVLESRGLEEQGIYRVVGVASKVQKLLNTGLDRRKNDRLANLEDPQEWETKTITSALKSYLRNLPEPLMTYRYHNGFIAAVKNDSRQMRVNDVHALVYRIPELNFDILKMLIKHLTRVAAKCDKSLMTVSNLGVCFGPTLLRPEEETVASIMDLKFYNIVVEILIDNYDKIFNSEPTHNVPSPEKLSPQTSGYTNNVNHIGGVNNLLPPASTGGHVSPIYITNDSPENNYIQIKTYPSNHVNSTRNYQPYTCSVRTYVEPTGPSNISSSLCNVHDPQTLPHFYNMTRSEKLPNNTSHQSPHHRKMQKFGNSGISSQSESNIPGMQSSSPTNFRIYGKLGEQNSASSSNESVSSNSRDSGNNIGYTSISPEKSKRINIGMSYPKGYRPQGAVRVRTLYACLGENDGELSFEPNQIITNVKQSQEPGWLEGTLNGKTGLIPENYVEMLP